MSMFMILVSIIMLAVDDTIDIHNYLMKENDIV